MKKEDFKYGDSKYFIEDDYVLDCKEYLLVINKEIFDEESIEYVNKIVKKYAKEKDKILEYMLKKRLRNFYKGLYNYSDEYIKRNIGRPKINVDCRKDNEHPTWRFKYAGSIEYCETNLDEHIIRIEFIDDLDLSESVELDG